MSVSLTYADGTHTHPPLPVDLGRPDRVADTGTGDVLDRIAAGAVRYTAECTALTVDEDRCCIITDHRLLPLSWTRDAYYQAAMLLCRSPPGIGLSQWASTR